MTENIVTLKDGRKLAFTEHGASDGHALIFIHGNPGSRLMRHPDESIAESMGVRIITPDRPGFGLSDFHEGRSLLSFADDIGQLADVLQLEQFALFGVSAGGPYTVAVAYKLGDRVTRAAIASGAAPFDRENAYEDVNPTYTQAYKLAKWPGWLLSPLMGRADKKAVTKPDVYWQGVLERSNDYDRKMLSNTVLGEQVKGYMPEAIRQGSRARVQEAKILVSPWGFPLEQVSPEVQLWYWDGDSIVPPQMGRYLESRIPNTQIHYLPGGGHFAFIEHWQDILKHLISG